jgi:DNA-binding transcriptional LysR family regulator
MLSSDQVLTFLAVLDQGGFSGAAKVLHRTQSSVTYAIQKLESDLGIVLFDRSVRRLTLTPQGRALHPIARRLAREVETMQRAAEGLAAAWNRRLCWWSMPLFRKRGYCPLSLACIGAFLPCRCA